MKGDVFSFAFVLSELVGGKSPFPKSLKQQAIAKWLIMDEARPDIPDFVRPEVGKLIRDCWASDPDDRPSFHEILEQLERMNFKLTAIVNSWEVSQFVKKVKDWEAARNTQQTSISLFS
jgi:serine/threonine protein kinase